MPLLVPPGAWHPLGHGAWHGRAGAGPGGSEERREEGEERGSGSRRGLQREMSSRPPGLDWLEARLGEFSAPGAPTPHARGPLGLGSVEFWSYTLVLNKSLITMGLSTVSMVAKSHFSTLALLTY